VAILRLLIKETTLLVGIDRAEKLLNYATHGRNKMEDADAAAYEDTAYRHTMNPALLAF
jgi:hypothetical protein